jgi:hypothetical protein
MALKNELEHSQKREKKVYSEPREQMWEIILESMRRSAWEDEPGRVERLYGLIKQRCNQISFF